MKLTYINDSGFKVLPKPALKIRKVQTSASSGKNSPEDEGYSVDEKTHLIINQIIDEANQLYDEETRDLWLDGVNTFKQNGDIESLIRLTEYRRQIVSLEEFMFGKAYLALNEDEIYPAVREACIELDTDKYVEAVFKGALGFGKTTAANVMLARGIYKISCMRHPQSSYGIQARSSIVFTIQSIRLATAKKAVFEEFGNYIKHSPYFRHIYPYDPLITSSMIFREQNLSIMPISSATTGAISMNVIAGILDEMNFMDRILKSKSQNAEIDGSYNQAKAIYNAISRRRRTRFAKNGRLPGILFLLSSSRFPDDFTETKAAESAMCGGIDPNIYVMSKSIWDGKGRNKYSSEEFRVLLGNNMIRSKILEDDEKTPDGFEVINVPQEFKIHFTTDLEGSLHDYAGITTLSSRPFLTNRNAIYDCIKAGEEAGYQNPFPREEYCFAYGIPHPDPTKLRLDIDIFRGCHIDLGWKRDACGIAIGHIAGQKLINRTDLNKGTNFTEMMPTIGFDVIMRVVPPPNGEIEFSQVREFLVLLRDRYKLPIEYVSFDGFQSADSLQILRKLGFKTDYMSVEKIEPYRSLRDALYDKRILLMPHQHLANELAGLEYTKTNNGKDEKVDHRPTFFKDVADAVCGTAQLLFKRRIAWSPILFSSNNAIKQEKLKEQEQREQEAQESPYKHLIQRKPVVRKHVVRKVTVRKSVFRRHVKRK